jgi:DNA-binding response OmpR family regulator
MTTAHDVKKGAPVAGRAAESVLLVDDEAYVMEVVKEIISHWVGRVDCATNGEDALRKAAGTDYDYILLDMKMPDINGMELYRRIRELKPGLAARVIFLTGDTESADVKAFFKLTGANYLSKPFAIRELLELMDRMPPMAV